jgi:hypothetical protein
MAYLEVVVASLIFALTLAGVGATVIAQEKLMRALEQRAYVLVPADRRVELALVHGSASDAFWPMGRLEATAPTQADLETIQGAAYGNMARSDLGALPRVLHAFDRRADRWPQSGRSLDSPRIVSSFNEGEPTFEVNHTLAVKQQTTSDDPSPTTTVVIDLTRQ